MPATIWPTIDGRFIFLNIRVNRKERIRTAESAARILGILSLPPN